MTNIWSLRQDISQREIFSLRQETDFHTGISQFQTLGSDSAVAGVFRDFSYQVAAVQLDSITSLEWTKNQKVIKADKWPKSLGKGDNNTHQPPFKLRYRLDFAQTSVAMDPIYGILGGAQLSLSDQMGNRYIHFLVGNSAQVQSDFSDPRVKKNVSCAHSSFAFCS